MMDHSYLFDIRQHRISELNCTTIDYIYETHMEGVSTYYKFTLTHVVKNTCNRLNISSVVYRVGRI